MADEDILLLAESISPGSVARGIDPEEFEHLIELTPDELRQFVDRYISLAI